MNRDLRDLLFSLGIIVTTAAYGLARRRTSGEADAVTSVAARVVEDVPARATVLYDGDGILDGVPGVGAAIRRAVDRDVRDEWEAVDLSGRDTLELVDVLQHDLPYYVSSGDEPHESGVYVKYGGATVVVTAVGYERVDSLSY